jgi:hypothetical protein
VTTIPISCSLKSQPVASPRFNPPFPARSAADSCLQLHRTFKQQPSPLPQCRPDPLAAGGNLACAAEPLLRALPPPQLQLPLQQQQQLAAAMSSAKRMAAPRLWAKNEIVQQMRSRSPLLPPIAFFLSKCASPPRPQPKPQNICRHPAMRLCSQQPSPSAPISQHQPPPHRSSRASAAAH